MVHVRTLRDDDLDAATRLWEAAEHLGPPPLAELDRIREVSSDLVLVATVPVEGGADRAVVGVVVGGDDGRRGWIGRLAVAEDVRRRGVARSLVAELERRFAARGLRQVNLLVFADNRAGRGLWEELGYRHSEGVEMYRRRLDPASDEGG